MKRAGLKQTAWLLCILMLAGGMSGCSKEPKPWVDKQPKTAAVTVQAAEFAPYTEAAVDEQPSLKSYQAAADLSNIENKDRFELSGTARQMLVQNGFVVLPYGYSEFYPLYEQNRYDNVVPNFITTDSMLHNYHLYFDYLLKTVEQEKLLPELKKLNQGMLKASEEQYSTLNEAAWKNAARRNLAFFAVADRLLDPESAVPSAVQKEVQAELKLIQAHRQTTISPVMSMGTKADVIESLKEDYTQYIPRGHYTHSEALKSYFKTMMWYGRITFRLDKDSETRSAVLMTLALQNKANLSSWQKIYSTSEFFVGRSDDPGFYEYMTVLKKIYGSKPTVKELITDNSKWQDFKKAAAKIKGPSINSIPIFDASIQPDREKAVNGFRFMGQRYTLDADIFQRLIYREVGENQQGERRVLPKGLDIPAALGSVEAGVILKDMGETDYQNYSSNMAKMQKYISDLPADRWHQNLYWSWLSTLQPLTWKLPDGYPSFMLNQAWTRKSLSTYLSSWTELKHDTILYAKQVYAEMGGGGDAQDDDRGYVEPNPQLYARLAALAGMTRDGLQSRGLISKQDAENLQRIQTLALDLKKISEKELKGQSLSSAEYELIRSYGGQLEHFWLETLKDQGDKGSNQLLQDNPAPLVADVATSPPDTVLEEATGYVQTIYTVVPVEGKLRIARGGVFSYYEFPWPADNRLTDKAWREILESQEAPEAPAWTSSFIARDGQCRIIMPWEQQEQPQP